MPSHSPARADGARSRATPTRLELMRFSLWAGVLGFGGGLSVLAMLRSRAVDERSWVTAREFDNTATVAQMLPGGAASNALALLGLRFFGTGGAIGAYATFIFPGFAAILILAGFYAQLAAMRLVTAFLGGLNAAVVGIVAAITLHMIRTSVGRVWQMGVSGVALALSLEGGASPGEVALIGVVAGLVIDLALKRARLARTRRRRASPPVGLPNEGEPLKKHEQGEREEHTELRSHVVAALGAALVANVGLGALFSLLLLFFRTGLGAYGGGFAIVPHLRATLVDTGALSESQFAAAVGIGKLTPGPVLLMATFIGYLKAGFPGAIASTVAIFSAPLLLAIALGRWLDRYRSRRAVRAGLRGLTPAVVGTMAAAAITLGTGLSGTGEIAIAGAVAMTMSRFQVSPILMLALGGVVRLVMTAFGW